MVLQELTAVLISDTIISIDPKCRYNFVAERDYAILGRWINLRHIQSLVGRSKNERRRHTGSERQTRDVALRQLSRFQRHPITHGQSTAAHSS